MNLQSAAQSLLVSDRGEDFVVARATRRVRFSQHIVCHLLVFAEAAIAGIVAALILQNLPFDGGGIRYAIFSGITSLLWYFL